MPWLQHRLRNRYLTRYAMGVPLQGDRILGAFKRYADALDGGLSPHLVLDGFWKPRTTEVIVDRVRPGTTVVDVGANLRYFTILMGALVGPKGRVLAFEPNPRCADMLFDSLIINGMSERVTLHRVPLADEGGCDMHLLIPDGFPGGAYLTDDQKVSGGRCAMSPRGRWTRSTARWRSFSSRSMPRDGRGDLARRVEGPPA